MSGHGGARPGAGRPTGAHNKNPMAEQEKAKVRGISLYSRHLEALERWCGGSKRTISQMVRRLIDQEMDRRDEDYLCKCGTDCGTCTCHEGPVCECPVLSKVTPENLEFYQERIK